MRALYGGGDGLKLGGVAMNDDVEVAGAGGAGGVSGVGGGVVAGGAVGAAGGAV